VVERRRREKGAGEGESLYPSPDPRYAAKSGMKRVDLADATWAVISDGPHWQHKEEK